MTSALSFVDVSKYYKKGRQVIHALRNISFEIGEGEVYGFVGPNGAGKSTTIKVMLDIINDYSGSVHIYGISAHQASARRHVAYVPESPALYEQLTPLELLHMALAMHGIKRSDSKEWCRQCLEMLSIAHLENQRIRHLSKGTVQRVALAHAMVTSPRLLVLDEPLSGLDPVGRKDFVELLSDYKKNGGSIFFTSHVLHDVERIADRFGFINKGELVTVRSPRDIAAEHADRYVARYRGNTNPFVNATTLREEEFEIECSQEALPQVMTALNEASCHIITVTPALSLETVFFKILSNYESTESSKHKYGS